MIWVASEVRFLFVSLNIFLLTESISLIDDCNPHRHFRCWQVQHSIWGCIAGGETTWLAITKIKKIYSSGNSSIRSSNH